MNLSSVCEVQRGEETDEVVRLRAGHPVTWSQRSDNRFFESAQWSNLCYCSNLNRRRYAQNDETLYVAPEDERTDYVSPLAYFFERSSLIL